ncbi:MFS transporter [Streptacidiphilus sp. PB12-B1b]|uniref:MFS transporter n=1 Tax=Streptacidiphilus sp. PB12-B1b TaxID=2705012 RepID=UPI001CDC9EF1|nr:MFS transporter [Streptacidiphilus sp. PB12-B1b]
MAHVTDDDVPGTVAPGAPPQPPPGAVGRGWLGGFVLANFGMQIALQTPSTFLIPQQIAAIDPHGKVVAYAWASAVGAVAGLVAAPLAGALSDRTTGRHGRRRPWMLGGTAASILVLAAMGLADSVWAVSLGALGLSAAMCALGAGLNTVVPDLVPVAERGRVLGWASVPQAAGLALGGVLVGLAPGSLAGYLVLAATLLLVLPFARSTPDRPLPREARQRLSWGLLLDGWRIDPRRTPDFAWALATRFIMYLGYGLGTLYIPYFLSDVVHRKGDLLLVVAVNAAAVVAVAVVSGRLSDRLGARRPLVSAGSVLMAVPALMLAAWPTWTMTLVSSVLLGVGFGVYVGVDLALVTQVLPSRTDSARDLAVAGQMGSLPYVLVPVLAAVIIHYLGGYSGLYVASGLSSLLGAALVWRIRSVR